MKNIVKPLGPALKRIPESPRDIAILQSFASSIFAARGTYGWGGWPMNLHLAMQWGGLDPKVIYEEEVVRDRLAGIKILVLAHCDILPKSALDVIIDFQRRGGIIVSDDFSTPAILPDICISVPTLGADAEKNKAVLVETGKTIARKLGKLYTPYTYRSNSDLIARVRKSGGGDYLFVVNDRRAYGDYFGPWKLVMEKGMPNSGEVAVSRKSGAVYNVAAHRPEPFKIKNGKTVVSVDFSTNDGRIYLLVPEKFAPPSISGANELVRGKNNALSIAIKTVSGKRTDISLPLEITILNADKQTVDGAGFVCAEKGEYTLNILPAMDEKSGSWTVSVRNLADNSTVRKVLRLR